MLSRAKRDYEAKRPSESTAPKNSLSRQLFPSSSPAQPQPNENIVEQLKRGTNPPARPNALSSTVTNVQSRSNFPASSHGFLPNNRRSLATLCHNVDSFRDEPHTIIPLDDGNGKSEKPTATDNVFIADDDLSDDDDLDLDFEQPSALPPIPPRTENPQSISTSATRLDLEAGTVPPASSILSWSQSSPSHHVAPRLPSPDMSTKRKPDVVDLDPPMAKKRSLPKNWARPQSTPEEQKDSQASDVQATPAAKNQSNNLLWDATTSAVKAQKKQLRDQLKRASSATLQHPMDDYQGPIGDQKPSKSGPAPANSAISLSKEQRHVKDLVCTRNQSVFFTGPAGTGKSVLMRAIIQELRKKWRKDPDRLAVTASTGLAACNIGGMTLHSFSGIGLGKEDVSTLIKKIRRNPKAKNRWLRTKVLIIDEISMVDGDLFDKLSQIGRVIRNNGRPWGGIQLVITGDFFQLPPVPDGADKRDIKFAFEAATWNTSIDHTIGLTEVFRQKDPTFANMLNEMRLGRISEETVTNFRKLARPLNFTDGPEVTELFPTRYEVDRSNQKRLQGLQSQTHRYDAIDSGDPAHRERLLQNMMAPVTLELRKGAQVMLIKNMDETLVNGSLGTVETFMSESSFEMTHGASGFGSDAEGNSTAMDADTRKRIMAFGRQLGAGSGGQEANKYPLVRFHAVDGSTRTLLCVPEEWKVELPNGEVQASRKQVPLILAWALSIHKAQGQTLERVKVDLGKIFEKGQAYVALSRATSQEGLQVLRFDKNKVMAHPRVVHFYNKLYSAESAVKVTGTKPTTQTSDGGSTAGPNANSRGIAMAGRAMAASG